MQIAIDGPSGAGKSTIAKRIAQAMGFIYIDTGAMYRAVGLYALRKGISTQEDAEGVAAVLEEIRLSIRHIDGTQHIFLNGEDVSAEIRKPAVSLAASHVAVIPAVRLKLVEFQRMLADQNNVIMDGRDVGTYILPQADIKIFLTASAEDRAMRRFQELKEKQPTITFEEVLADMKFRDKNDSSRAFAPLKAAEDAEIVDTTGNTLEQSVQMITDLIQKRRTI